MKLVAWHQGFEVWRTSAGHLVVVDPYGSVTDRANLVELLLTADALDALFFPTVEAAVATIDGFIGAGLVRP
jgi:hypothetical protein